ncbi:hypothetical protein U703_08255 [Rhodobacter capsulatus YW1]|nr:hypothetical protein U703_08255 [Rhodobacter capsulatus YW1]
MRLALFLGPAGDLLAVKDADPETVKRAAHPRRLAQARFRQDHVQLPTGHRIGGPHQRADVGFGAQHRPRPGQHRHQQRPGDDRAIAEKADQRHPGPFRRRRRDMGADLGFKLFHRLDPRRRRGEKRLSGHPAKILRLGEAECDLAHPRQLGRGGQILQPRHRRPVLVGGESGEELQSLVLLRHHRAHLQQHRRVEGPLAERPRPQRAFQPGAFLRRHEGGIGGDPGIHLGIGAGAGHHLDQLQHVVIHFGVIVDRLGRGDGAGIDRAAQIGALVEIALQLRDQRRHLRRQPVQPDRLCPGDQRRPRSIGLHPLRGQLVGHRRILAVQEQAGHAAFELLVMRHRRGRLGQGHQPLHLPGIAKRGPALDDQEHPEQQRQKCRHAQRHHHHATQGISGKGGPGKSCFRHLKAPICNQGERAAAFLRLCESRPAPMPRKVGTPGILR